MKMGVFRRYPVPLEKRKIKLLIDQRTDSRPFHYMRKEFFCFHGNLCQNQNGSTLLCQNNLTTSGLGLSLSPAKWPVSCILTTDFKLKIRYRNEEISYQMHAFVNSRYLLALKNTFELPYDEMSFIYLKIQAANLRAHILTDLNNENRNVNTNKFLT